MNYKNILFSTLFILFIGFMQPTPAMEKKGQQQSQEQQINKLLLEAYKKGNFGLVKYLIEKNRAQVNILLFEAYKEGNFGFVKCLIENGANVNAKDNKEGSLLCFASGEGYFELVKYLVEKGADVNAKDNQKFTPLHIACINKRFNVTEYLIEKNANIEAENDQKLTPLHFACEKGYLNIAMHLIEKGANVHAEAAKKFTPLLFACQNGHFNVVVHLIEKGADINIESEEKATPLLLACQNGHFNIVKHLITKDAHLNAEDHMKFTPLHFACQNGHFEITKHLTQKGAYFDNNENYTKFTPLHLACQNGYFEIVKHLIAEGANIYAEVDRKCNLLHIAAINNRTDIVRYLLKSFPNLIDMQTVDGFTALDMAYEQKKEAVVKLFTKHGIRSTSEKQAETNMRAFFAELEEEKLQTQIKTEQKKQKRITNKGQEQKIQNINNATKQNKIQANNQKKNPTSNAIATTVSDSSINDTMPIILVDNPTTTNTVITSSAETAPTISEIKIIDNSANKLTDICSPINNACSSNNEIIISTKKQQDSILKSDNKSAQPHQPIQTQQYYQVGHDIKLKWPRSLNGAKYNTMRDHLRQLRHWPETTGLDIKILKGQSGMFRLRVGGYRVLFKVNEAQRRIIIYEIGLRKKVYRNL